jgi:hypothetical protein
MIIPNIAKFHIRYITQALAGDECEQHSIPHVLMVCIGNIENPPPFFQIKTLPGDTAPWLL